MRLKGAVRNEMEHRATSEYVRARPDEGGAAPNLEEKLTLSFMLGQR